MATAPSRRRRPGGVAGGPGRPRGGSGHRPGHRRAGRDVDPTAGGSGPGGSPPPERPDRDEDADRRRRRAAGARGLRGRGARRRPAAPQCCRHVGASRGGIGLRLRQRHHSALGVARSPRRLPHGASRSSGIRTRAGRRLFRAAAWSRRTRPRRPRPAARPNRVARDAASARRGRRRLSRSPSATAERSSPKPNRTVRPSCPFRRRMRAVCPGGPGWTPAGPVTSLPPPPPRAC